MNIEVADALLPKPMAPDSEKMKTPSQVDVQPLIKLDPELACVTSLNHSQIQLSKGLPFLKGNMCENAEKTIEGQITEKFLRGKWTEEEHNKLLEALRKFGNNWAKVSKYIGTRTRAQARSHTQKYFEKLKQEQLAKLMADPDTKKKRIFLITRQYLNRSFLNAKEINEFEVLPIQRKRKKEEPSKLCEKQNSGLAANKTSAVSPNLCPAGPSAPSPIPYILPIPPAMLQSFYQVNGAPSFFYFPYN